MAAVPLRCCRLPLNTKMLHPREVVGRAEAAWRAGPCHGRRRGFIRQILGWRSTCAHLWARMPAYAEANALGQDRRCRAGSGPARPCAAGRIHRPVARSTPACPHPAPDGDRQLRAAGRPRLRPRLPLVPGAHRRLRVGRAAQHPGHESQFADGGLLATKPYMSSAAYVDRMGDYCKGCHYDKKARSGEPCLPVQRLYWDFSTVSASASATITASAWCIGSSTRWRRHPRRPARTGRRAANSSTAGVGRRRAGVIMQGCRPARHVLGAVTHCRCLLAACAPADIGRGRVCMLGDGHIFRDGWLCRRALPSCTARKAVVRLLTQTPDNTIATACNRALSGVQDEGNSYNNGVGCITNSVVIVCNRVVTQADSGNIE